MRKQGEGFRWKSSERMERLKAEGPSMAAVRDRVAALRAPQIVTIVVDPAVSPTAAFVDAFRSDYLRKMREQMEPLPFSERISR